MQPRPRSLGARGGSLESRVQEVTRQPHGDLVPSAVPLGPRSEGAPRRAAGGGDPRIPARALHPCPRRTPVLAAGHSAPGRARAAVAPARHHTPRPQPGTDPDTRAHRYLQLAAPRAGLDSSSGRRPRRPRRCCLQAPGSVSQPGCSRRRRYRGHAALGAAALGAPRSLAAAGSGAAGTRRRGRRPTCSEGSCPCRRRPARRDAARRGGSGARGRVPAAGARLSRCAS